MGKILGFSSITASISSADLRFLIIGVIFEERANRMRESLEIIRRLLDGEKLNYDGEFYQTKQAKLYSPPKDHIPIIATSELINKNKNEEWIKIAEKSTYMPWVFLTAGISLGAAWSYEVLGWGGYWGWDPIENVGLMPWLVLTALIHSLMGLELRG